MRAAYLLFVLILVGCAAAGPRSGHGTYTWGPSSQYRGDTYVGFWRNGERHGSGTYTCGPYSKCRGDIFVGEWRNGKQHGEGTYYHADGRVLRGVWENGLFVRSLADNPVKDPERSETTESASKVSVFADIEDPDLCKKAVNTTTGDWDVRDEWKPYTDEAKRRGLTCDERFEEVRGRLAKPEPKEPVQTEAEREEALSELKINPSTKDIAEEVALSTPFDEALVPQMNDLMLCVQGQFRKNATLISEIGKRGIRCDKLLELMR